MTPETASISPSSPRRPPGPRSVIGLRNMRSFRRDLLGHLETMQRRYGDVVAFRMARYRVVLLSHPDDIEAVLVRDARNFTKGLALKMSRAVLGDGLLTSENPTHREHRRMIQPVFYPARINDYAAIFNACAAEWSRRWQDGATVDMAREMRRLTLAIVTRTLFGREALDDTDTLIEALHGLTALFRRVTLPGARLLGRLPLASNRAYHEARSRLDAALYGLIAEHRAEPVGRSDLLSRLIEARDDEGGGGRFTDPQVRDHILTLFAAGHETTALALSWTWWLLSEHPEAERRLHAEIDTVLGGRPAVAADLERLPYTRAVLTESMRLRPPAYAIGRTAETDYRVGDYIIPAQTTVLVSQHVVHRDPRWFPDPQRFDPDRWTDAFRATLPRFAYFPFGGGPRICIGEGFAWAEAMIVLATLAGRWSARLVPGHPVEAEPLITLRPRWGLRMTLAARRSS